MLSDDEPMYPLIEARKTKTERNISDFINFLGPFSNWVLPKIEPLLNFVFLLLILTAHVDIEYVPDIIAV